MVIALCIVLGVYVTMLVQRSRHKGDYRFEAGTLFVQAFLWVTIAVENWFREDRRGPLIFIGCALIIVLSIVQGIRVCRNHFVEEK